MLAWYMDRAASSLMGAGCVCMYVCSRYLIGTLSCIWDGSDVSDEEVPVGTDFLILYLQAPRMLSGM